MKKMCKYMAKTPQSRLQGGHESETLKFPSKCTLCLWIQGKVLKNKLCERKKVKTVLRISVTSINLEPRWPGFIQRNQFYYYRCWVFFNLKAISPERAATLFSPSFIPRRWTDCLPYLLLYCAWDGTMIIPMKGRKSSCQAHALVLPVLPTFQDKASLGCFAKSIFWGKETWGPERVAKANAGQGQGQSRTARNNREVQQFRQL